MGRFLLVGLAGAIGTWCRYLVGLCAARSLGAAFPYGTLLVNIVGSFLIAVVLTRLAPSTLRITLATGFLGGFTTYSAFNFETTALLRERPLAGVLNLGLTLLGCFVAGVAGVALARR